MSTIHGTIWWSELRTGNVEASRAYYEATCGWHFETWDMPDGPYHVAMAHGRPVAGMMELSEPGADGTARPHWFTYVAVDDLDAALRTMEAKGGKILRAPFEVPETGTIALVQDAGGAEVGLMTPVQNWESAPSEVGLLDNVPV
ncbi:MAG: VOC family protein [Pseudomonadota bacterium]